MHCREFWIEIKLNVPNRMERTFAVYLYRRACAPNKLRLRSFHALFIYLLKQLFIRGICKLRFVWLLVTYNYTHRHRHTLAICYHFNQINTHAQQTEKERRNKSFPFSFCIAETHTHTHAHHFSRFLRREVEPNWIIRIINSRKYVICINFSFSFTQFFSPPPAPW